MKEIGQTYVLYVIKKVSAGVYLDGENLGEILLPRKHAPADLAVGDSVNIFLYYDSEDRPIATTQQPKAQVGEFAYLEVVANTQVGAFLDWGLDKDVLVPFAEQHLPMQVGKSYLIHLYLDPLDGRIAASSKIDHFLDDNKPHSFKAREKVSLLVANTTELGFKAIVNHSHWGVLYKSDVFQRLSFGQTIQGFIKQIRPDGKIDLTLQGGQETRDKNTSVILQHLQENDGFSELHDKSDPKKIAALYGMSKGAFKKAIGGLYKQKLISIEKNGIRLLEKTEKQTEETEQPSNKPANIWKK